METFTKTLVSFNNISLIQFETLEDEGFPFKPAGPAIEKEGLIIKEFQEEGVVSKLLAINSTADFLLLTDMDILKGAKQNRVVNTSVLIAPNSKSELDVSCVEKYRWTYTSPSFKMSPQAMDFNLRSAKASKISNRISGVTGEENLQSRVWNMINDQVTESRMENRTQDYEKYLESERKKNWSERQIQPEKSCNGLAVMMNKQIVTCDLFGNRDVFRHYFPKLKDAALMYEMPAKKDKPVEQAEAFYKLDEFLDLAEKDFKPSDEHVAGMGKIRRIKNEDIPGFELSYNGQMIHLAAFSKTQE